MPPRSTPLDVRRHGAHAAQGRGAVRRRRRSPTIPQQLQAEGTAIVASLKTGGFTAAPDDEIVALIAYLQRLGKDGTAAITAGATRAPAP